MIKNRRALLAICSVAVLVAAACGSSAKSRSGAGHVYSIGLLTDATGAASAGNKTSVQGFEAGILVAKRHGYTIRPVIADTQSSPATALSAAQKLVEEDHVLAVVADSALTFAAASYLSSHGIPVIGPAQDGPEWQTDTNMFSPIGATHTTKVATTQGLFLKMEGATNVGVLGYGISPLSAEGAKQIAVSAQSQGLKAGYVNANFQFGSTNVQPVAIAMKDAGIDAFSAATEQNTAFALMTALRQLGVDLKVPLMPSGYGNDLFQSGPAAVQTAQNAYFQLGFEPVEMHTAATEQFQKDLRAVGANPEPTWAEYLSYTSVGGLLVRGLEGAGANPTHASLVSALSRIHDFDALGLFGGRKLDVNDRQNIVTGVDNCQWFVKLVGNSFEPVPGADPLCGKTIPGAVVSASS